MENKERFTPLYIRHRIRHHEQYGEFSFLKEIEIYFIKEIEFKHFFPCSRFTRGSLGELEIAWKQQCSYTSISRSPKLSLVFL